MSAGTAQEVIENRSHLIPPRPADVRSGMPSLNTERRGHGEPMVLLHGIGGELCVWEPVLDALAGGGAYFFRRLADSVIATLGVEEGPTDQALEAVLWDLLWAGHLTNDTLAPLRMLTSGGRGAHRARRPAPRARTLAVRWLVNFARARNEKSMSERLAREIMDASSQQGGAFKRKDDIYRMAQANKAFAHYRW